MWFCAEVAIEFNNLMMKGLRCCLALEEICVAIVYLNNLRNYSN